MGRRALGKQLGRPSLIASFCFSLGGYQHAGPAWPQGDRLTRVELNIETIKDSLTEIKAVLRKSK